jgi:hypothetical protein
LHHYITSISKPPASIIYPSFSHSHNASHSHVSGYIGEVEIIDDRRAGKVVVNLIGRLNKCGVISPRFDVGLKDIEKWTNNLLPSRQFGKLVLTTSAGACQRFAACTSPFLSNMHSRRTPQASWTTTRLVARALVARSWASSTK